MAEKKIGGFTKSQWEDLIKRLNDPKDPAGNYRSPGGSTFDVNKMKQVKGKSKKEVLALLRKKTNKKKA
tara:strand:- start:47 stop:253 length:207 start_codon:yes stop_codon:yes gene_type:complete